MKNGRKAFQHFLCLLVVGTLLFPEAFFLLPTACAQTDPPPLGEGIWIINDATLLKDQTVRLNGSIVINPPGSLTLENSTLLLKMPNEFDRRITVRAGAGLYIYNGSYLGAYDAAYCVYFEPGSVGRVRNSTIANHDGLIVGSQDLVVEDSSLSTGFYGLVVWGGKATVRNSEIDENQWGIWDLYGNLEVYNSTFDGNGEGVELSPVCGGLAGSRLGKWAPGWSGPVGDICNGPRSATVDGSTIARSTLQGMFINGGTATVSDNDFKESAGFGIKVYTSTVNINNNKFTNLSKGLDVEPNQGSASMVDLLNNDFLDCYNYGVYFTDFSGLTSHWTIDRPVHINSIITTRSMFDVKDGGHLHVMNTSLGLLSISAKPIGIDVESGGEVVLDHVALGPVGAFGNQTYFTFADGARGTIRNCTLAGVGQGTGLEPGFDSYGQLIIDNTLIRDADQGVMVSGGTALVHNSTFTHNYIGIYASGAGQMSVYDSEFWAPGNWDIFAELGGRVDLYNVTSQRVQQYTGAIINNSERCRVKTMWQNGAPLGNVSYTLTENYGGNVESGVTGPDGYSKEFMVRDYVASDDYRGGTGPHNLTGTVMGLTNWTLITVEGRGDLGLYIRDGLSPSINITSPGLVVYQTNNTLKVNGTASDNESGLDRVEWSYDLDLWYEATGAQIWNFTIALPYGTTVIFIRALDKAGNEKVLTLTATIDNVAPYLLLTSPHNGTVTSFGTVLFEGLAQIGSTVTAGPVSLTTLDGTFRMSVPLAEGPNDLVVTATAPSGLWNSTMVTVVRDSLPPPIIIKSPHQDYITNKVADKVLTVSGLIEPNATFSINGKNIPLNNDGTFSITVDIKEGLNVINFVAKDKVGNLNSSVLRVLYDVRPPALSVYGPADNAYTNGTAAHVSGLTEPGLNVSASTQNHTSASMAGSDGRFELDIGLSEGLNLVTIMVRDSAGNPNQTVRKVTSDTVPPKITTVSIYEGIVVAESRIFVEGQTEAGAMVKVNGNLVDAGYTGQFSKWVDLPSATNTITIDSVDRAGNRATLTVHVLRKAQPGPVNGGLKMGPDYFPWVLLLIIILFVVQLVLYYRYSLNKAKQKDKAAQARTLLGGTKPRAPPKGPGQRVAPKRDNPRSANAQGPEFDIEHNEGTKGGGRR